MFVTEPATVAIVGDDVTVTSAPGRTEVFHGSSPSMQSLTAKYTFTPAANGRATQCLRPPCGCPVQFTVYPYDQGTNYSEQYGSINWSYNLIYHAPSWDDEVSGTEHIDFSGGYTADGSSFDMDFGTYSGIHVSAVSYSQFTVYNGGASQDAIGVSTLLVDFTDIYSNHWDAKGIKSRNRCAT